MRRWLGKTGYCSQSDLHVPRSRVSCSDLGDPGLNSRRLPGARCFDMMNNRDDRAPDRRNWPRRGFADLKMISVIGFDRTLVPPPERDNV